jgi:hypothetical protein
MIDGCYIILLFDSIIVLLFFYDLECKELTGTIWFCTLIYVFIHIFFKFCSAMEKEVVDMSTDEESDCVVICPPNGNTDHKEVVSGTHDEDSPERHETPYAIDSHMDSNAQEDVPVNQDSPKLIDEQESSLTNSPAKPAIAGQQGSRHSVPEPCTVAAERRSSTAGTCAPISHPTSSGEKLSDKSSSSPRSMAKKV